MGGYVSEGRKDQEGGREERKMGGRKGKNRGREGGKLMNGEGGTEGGLEGRKEGGRRQKELGREVGRVMISLCSLGRIWGVHVYTIANFRRMQNVTPNRTNLFIVSCRWLSYYSVYSICGDESSISIISITQSAD